MQEKSGCCRPALRAAVCAAICAVFAVTTGALAAEADAQKQTDKGWTLVGPLGATPKGITDAFPLSDQENKSGWVKYEPMSDEFDGPDLDTKKWVRNMYWWKGRQPALFREQNVTVSGGKLHLTMRKEKLPEAVQKNGYRDYSSAAVHSTTRTCYGHFEVKAKPMDSAGSSSFWFQQDGVREWATEIDVFEIGGKAPGFEKKYNMNLHVFRTPTEKRHWSVGGCWIAPWRLADDYHVYGLEWDKDKIEYFVDGVVVRKARNTHWRQPLYLIFDSETMPDWFGMPRDEDLPSTFSIEYVRAWKSAH
jgi:beta-glucanase (GH16 family)